MFTHRGHPAEPDVEALLRAHLAGVSAISPPESTHAFDAARLAGPGITLWAVRASDDPASELMGVGALLELDAKHGEIKSMRTVDAHRCRGVGATLVGHMIHQARQLGYDRLSLETGAQPEFEPARRLYARFGFEECGPFAGYAPDPNSVFMTRPIEPLGER